MANSAYVKVVSWNINGCGNPMKRKKVLLYLKHKQVDIAFIQETHLLDEEAKKFKKDWVGHVYYSSFSSKRNGVLILVHKRLNFSMLKEYKDDNGRIICIEANINGGEVTLCNIYAPNKEDPSFFHGLNNILGNAQGQIILAGDFNQILDGMLDKSKHTGTSTPRDRAAIHMLMGDIGLVDIWRLVNPRNQEYTFYSNCHKSYSRIDYFLISQSLVNDTIDSSINAISLSDHAPVELCINIHSDRLRRGRWRMNTSLIQDKVFYAELTEDLSSFFEINMGSTESVAMVWEASKAYIRGKLIAKSSKKKKEQKDAITKLEAELNSMERELAEHYSESLVKDICKCKLQIHDIFNKKAEYALFRLKTSFYESGEKTGRLLARQLKEQNSAYVIPAIRSGGALITSTKGINDVFRDFYENLYSSAGAINELSARDFFSNINLPSLSADQVTLLEASITQDEVKTAILSMSAGKSPGPDGFPVEYYKAFINIITPILTMVFEEAFQSGSLPPTFNEGLISLIPKKGKDHTDPTNFRPISLINVDRKVLAKVLALRLETILPHIIHIDQVGFIKGRSSTDNLRRLMHLIWLNGSSTMPVAAVSLDARAAFDRVEWGFLHSTLLRFGFGSGFAKWVKIIYNQPKASVLTNGLISSPFDLSRGTRQGCPLSPLLFTIALEPLAVTIRMNPAIKGVEGGGAEHKLMLYADDILFLTSDPHNSLPALMNTIDIYSTLSGYQINWTKSEGMPISKHCHPHMLTQYNFRWIPKGMIYLGVKLTSEIGEMVTLNFDPLLQKMKTSLGKWGKLNLSLWGKINVIKMVIAPQFNYISMMLPLCKPEHIYKQYESIIRDFLWAGRKPRFKWSKMCAPKEKGGLGLPDVRLYSLAFEMSKIGHHWRGTGAELVWVDMETNLASPFHPMHVLSQCLKNKDKDTNPVIKHSQEVWAKVHKLHKISHYKQMYASLWLNPEIKIGKQKVFWKKWLEKGICTVKDLYKEGIFMSFNDLVQQYQLLENGDFWKYLQIRHCVMKKFESQNLANPIVRYLENPLNRKASTFYQNSMSLTSGMCDHLRIIWQRDLNCEISEEVWNQIIAQNGRYVKEARGKFIQYKVLHRYYWTPCRLFKVGLTNNDLCWKCTKEMGTYLHVIWECPMVKPLWHSVLKYLEAWAGVTLPVSPRLCLLGDKTETPTLNRKAYSILMVGITTCLRIILRYWKSTTCPSLQEWKILMTEATSYEVMLARIRSKGPVELGLWDFFMAHLTSN